LNDFEALSRILKLLVEFFREIEALIRNLRFFQRLRGFLETFSLELRLFSSDVRFIQRISGFFKLRPDK
jgi:hypothetical protein